MPRTEIKAGVSDLVNDLAQVQQVGSMYSGHIDAIDAYFAPPEFVIDWYTAQDPLNEFVRLSGVLFMQSGLGHLYREHLHQRAKTIRAYEAGAAIVASSVISPDIEAAAYSVRRERGELDPRALINYCLSTSDKSQFSPEDIIKLFLSAEMLIMAANEIPEADDLLAKKPEELTNLHKVRFDNTRTRSNFGTAGKLHSFAEQQLALINFSDRDALIADLRTRWLISSHLLDTWLSVGIDPLKTIENKGQNASRFRRKTLSELIDGLKAHFLDAESVFFKIPKREMRGILHELIWYLDTQIYLEMINDYDTHVTTASSFQDQPHLLFPRFNRAFDILLSSGFNQRYIQLKSKPAPKERIRYSSLYHPEIVVVTEDNFHDTDPKRLAAKLEKYGQLIDSGFDEDNVQTTRRYLLESVTAQIDDFASIKNRSEDEMADGLYKSYALTDGSPRAVPSASLEGRQYNRKTRRSIKKIRRSW